jgi:heat shock protein HslJ
MPDPTTDDPIPAQLRAWADDLADQVGPVAPPVAQPRRRSVRGLALAAGVLAVLGVATALVVAGDGADDDDVRVGATTTTVAPGSEVPLLGSTWWLQAIGTDQDGDLGAVDDDGRPFVTIGPCDPDADCERDLVVSGYDGCNTFSGSLEAGADDMVVGEVISTQRGCEGPGSEVPLAVVRLVRGVVGIDVAGDVLTLRGNGVEAAFRAGDGIHPPLPEGATVITVPGQHARHRLVWRVDERAAGPVVELRADLADMNTRDVLTAELGPEPGRMVAVARSGTRPTIVIGLVDARATTVTFDRREGDDPTAPTVALAGRDDLRAFALWVPGVGGPWSMTATDAAGATVAAFEPER